MGEITSSHRDQGARSRHAASTKTSSGSDSWRSRCRERRDHRVGRRARGREAPRDAGWDTFAILEPPLQGTGPNDRFNERRSASTISHSASRGEDLERLERSLRDAMWTRRGSSTIRFSGIRDYGRVPRSRQRAVGVLHGRMSWTGWVRGSPRARIRTGLCDCKVYGVGAPASPTRARSPAST